MSKFWSTQPVNKGIYPEFINGQIKELDKNMVDNYLPDNLMWFSLDVNDNFILNAIHEFLSNHYVTDVNNMYRLDYSKEFLKFGLTYPNYNKDLHLGLLYLTPGCVTLVGFIAGSLVNLNPAANLITINKDSHVVQPLTLQKQNFILNQNFYPIQSVDLSINRDSTFFSARPLNEGDTVAYGQFNISNFEHGIVFDNVTVFNDVLYNLTTGLRQNRILTRGTKSAEWNGTVDAQGFILNQDNIEEWSPNSKYTRGSIVKYKNRYWFSLNVLNAKEIFEEQDWKVTDYNEIQKGLLPNSSTRSY